MSNSIRLALHKLFLRVLGPLVRLAIKHGISHGEFSEMAKEAYVRQSYQNFALPNRKMSISRVAVLTGLSRKEVVRLTSDDISEMAPRITLNRAARVVMGWLSDAAFCDSAGEPKVLPFKDGEHSFTALVERFSGDVPAAAVLEELIYSGVATKLEEQQSVRLNNRGYIPNSSEVGKMDILATCAKDLLQTGIHNIEAKSPDDARLQRQLVYRVPDDLAKEFKHYSEQKMQDLLLDLNLWLREKRNNYQQFQDHQSTDIGFGVYFTEDSRSGDKK